MNIKIQKCRVCGNANLENILDLGEQMLTGVFPGKRDTKITSGPLRLVKCHGEGDICGLVQLDHSYDLSEMYGINYGYRSGLNVSMVNHLHAKVKKILDMIPIEHGDLIIDIGSNDSTTLQAYPKGPILVGVDPTGIKFKDYYPDHVHLIPDFFSAERIEAQYPGKKAKVITSFSMFYDLESPLDFMREVHSLLDDEGVWIFEQSYLPTMLDQNSYDTVCHEHLEFYALKQIKWMADRVGLRIIDIEFNDINGGSFSIVAAKSANQSEAPMVSVILESECARGLDTLRPFAEFQARIEKTKTDLLGFIQEARKQGKYIAAIGASTKGNVILQFCGLSEADVTGVGEVNSDKVGCYTPGTWIPIISEDALLAARPDYLIVLPWHFREFFMKNRKFSGLNLVFPLPEVEVVKVC